jgi:hypothetical protein
MRDAYNVNPESALNEFDKMRKNIFMKGRRQRARLSLGLTATRRIIWTIRGIGSISLRTPKGSQGQDSTALSRLLRKNLRDIR